MTDTATSRYGARQQSQGSNTNTWGEDKLNEALRLFDRGSKGVQSIAMTGDQTLSWSNYVATNTGQCAVLVLTGSLSSAATLIVPSVEWHWILIKNAIGQTITVKTAAGTGVAIPNGRGLPVYSDATDCYNGMGANIPTPASIEGALTVAGQISGVAAGTAGADAVNVTQLSATIASAIAAAALTASGQVLNSVTDTTPGYLVSKLAVSGGLTKATTNAGGNESATLGIADASTAAKGAVRLATIGETVAGSDATIAITPAGLGAGINSAASMAILSFIGY